MGNLFRRVTLASLGLDSMEGVSEQSFDVIDKADSFVARLMDGVSHVMPKRNAEALDGRITSLSDHLLEGMSGLNGPKSATDLQEWQYWLDAALLMLFDEDEEEESGYAGSGAPKAARRTYASSKANAEAVRRRVAELQKSGVKPAMLQALPAAQKRSLFDTVKKFSEGNQDMTSVKAMTGTQDTLDMASSAISSFLKAAYASDRSMTQAHNAERILATNSKQMFASHVAEKAQGISLQVMAAEDNMPQLRAAREQWTKAFEAMGSQAKFDGKNVRAMLTALDELVKMGAVDSAQAQSLREASSTYARRVLLDEIAHDTVAVADRIQKMMDRAASPALGSQRAIATIAPAQSGDSTADAVFKRSFAMIEQHLSELNKAVSSRVLTDGDSAATVRWSRAADRFTRLQGVSDEIDRVLLKDVVESASALESAGIVPRSFVSQMVSMASATENKREISAVSGSMIRERSTEPSFASFGTSRVLGKLADRIESSVGSLVSELSGSGIAQSSVESFVSDIQQLVRTGRNADMRTVAQQAASVVESVCSRLDEFAEMAANAVVSAGYADLGDARGTFVNTAEAPEAPVTSSRAQIFAVQQQLAKVQAQAHAEAVKMMQQNADVQARLSATEQQMMQAVSAASSLEELVSAQNAIAPHLNDERRAELAKTVDAVRKSQEQLLSVEKQIRLVENAVKFSQSLRNAVSSRNVASEAAKPVVMDDVRINGDYLTALNGTLQSYARIRNEFSFKAPEAPVAGMTDGRIERMLSIVKPMDVEKQSSGTLSVAEREILANARTQFSVGYSEIVPESVQASQVAGYPSRSSMQDLSKILGVRKAAEIHAADVVSGRSSSVEALASSIQKMANGRMSAMDSSRSGSAYETERKLVAAQKSQQAVASIRDILAKRGGNAALAGVLSASDFARVEQILSNAAPAVSEVSELQKIFARNAEAARSDSSAVAEILRQGNLTEKEVASVNALMARHAISQADAETVKQILSKSSVSSDDVRVVEQIFARAASQSVVSDEVSAEIAKVVDGMSVQDADIAATTADRALSMADKAFAAAESGMTDISSYAVTDAGEHVKVSLKLRPETAGHAFGLRQNVGESYLPMQARTNGTNAVSANVTVSPILDSSLIGNAAEFVPVSAGLMQGANASQASAAEVAEGRDVLKGIIGRFGILSRDNRQEAEGGRFHLNIGGVDFDMSSNAFVQMVAKPVLSSASQNMPTMMDANNVLFAGYASLLNELGEKRSIQAIRNAYVETLARNGAQSVRSEIGFNTQSFAGILGATAGEVQTSERASRASASYSTDSETILLNAGEGVQSAQGVSSGYAAGEKFASDMMSHSQSVAFGSDSNAQYSWVSNQVRVHAAHSAEGASRNSGSANSHMILGRLDNLLDYVENMSERNVGVFSSDDTVRVMLEALPKEGSLGNKGLPKWRQKDSRAARAAEARELREALAKIGASPVQGVQRFANKQYVSPNLMQDQSAGAAPLYSGGSDGGSSSSSSASSSAATSNTSSGNYSITDNDIAALADEIYRRIEESINDEFDRRRN
jgi:hypothetical protein